MNDRHAAAACSSSWVRRRSFFEVLWVKPLSFVVGVDVYAVTVGVGAFIAGPGARGGNRKDRVVGDKVQSWKTVFPAEQ